MAEIDVSSPDHAPARLSLLQRCKEAVLGMWPMGWIAFGGPQGFIALLFKTYVVERKWITEEIFLELYAVAMAQPGLPSAVMMACLGYGISIVGSSTLPIWVLYLERSLAAVSIGLVIVSTKSLAVKILVDKTTSTLAAIAIVLILNFSTTAWLLPVMTFSGGLVTYLEAEIPFGEKIIHSYDLPRPIVIFTTFYFYGTVLFGGIIPILYSYLVTGNQWLSSTEFLMGFAVMSILPGFGYNFSAYCGALAFRGSAWTSFVGAFLAWAGLFGPGCLLNAGLVPIWKHYRDLPVLKKVFKGLNSVSVGLMIGSVFLLVNKAVSLPGNKVAALGEYPGWTAVMVVSVVAMDTWKVQPWWLIISGAVVGAVVWVADGKP
ncbi:hypothetical protein BCR33DRAFT_772339 [Rhizoclosmatium globosum]|uniref:Chromate transporter n=1 Tax=Rhizoclosmatium globosum TaxID=329046 RepID=A0A1Y2B585_9FUNG|nr:hypothetical protein BCR33DRAFT_772339 [Rhizoclosmatium globosum]|eukprot:ORY29904.1 hypothetical protein BCR33DRAFT_772339 [Rhizoclosmatium globosum]